MYFLNCFNIFPLLQKLFCMRREEKRQFLCQILAEASGWSSLRKFHIVPIGPLPLSCTSNQVSGYVLVYLYMRIFFCYWCRRLEDWMLGHGWCKNSLALGILGHLTLLLELLMRKLHMLQLVSTGLFRSARKWAVLLAPLSKV